MHPGDAEVDEKHAEELLSFATVLVGPDNAQGALPEHVAAADAGCPPWSVIPACAPGQIPDPNASSANACVGNP